MSLKPALFVLILVAQLTLSEQKTPLVLARLETHESEFGDYNADGKLDSAYFVPAPYDSALARSFPDGPDPWRFFLRFSDSALDSIPVHYTYELHSTSDISGDGADELLLVQPLAGYYRVMTFDKRVDRWNQLLTVSSPKENSRPADWVYTRTYALFYLTNRSHNNMSVDDKWEWIGL